MLSRVTLSTLGLLAVFTFNGCAASTEEEEDSMEAEGATRVGEKDIEAGRTKLIYLSPRQSLRAKLAVDEGQDWEFVENAPWLATLPKPEAKLAKENGRNFRIFEWGGSKTSNRGAFGVFLRLIDTTTKKPVLDERRQPVMAGAIVSFDSSKTITVTTEMPAQTILVPRDWILELKLPRPRSGYDWRLDLPNGTRIDPFIPSRALDGFEPAEGPRAPDYLFRFRPTKTFAAPMTLKFVSVALAPEAETDPRSYPDDKRVEFKASVY